MNFVLLFCFVIYFVYSLFLLLAYPFVHYPTQKNLLTYLSVHYPNEYDYFMSFLSLYHLNPVKVLKFEFFNQPVIQDDYVEKLRRILLWIDIINIVCILLIILLFFALVIYEI